MVLFVEIDLLVRCKTSVSPSHMSIKILQDDVEARVVVGGLSTTCSQKIHNQLV